MNVHTTVRERDGTLPLGGATIAPPSEPMSPMDILVAVRVNRPAGPQAWRPGRNRGAKRP